MYVSDIYHFYLWEQISVMKIYRFDSLYSEVCKSDKRSWKKMCQLSPWSHSNYFKSLLWVSASNKMKQRTCYCWGTRIVLHLTIMPYIEASGLLLHVLYVCYNHHVCFCRHLDCIQKGDFLVLVRLLCVINHRKMYKWWLY